MKKGKWLVMRKTATRKIKWAAVFGVFVDQQDSADTVRRASSVNFERSAEICNEKRSNAMLISSRASSC
jgi:hypothetical protein